MSAYVHTQPKCFFEHFGSEDGLPQHTVMSIVQDKKGFMWFSTWDGLCKFDGYDFYIYKMQRGDAYPMRSNRIDLIREDIYGNIWALPYDREPHRFDPKTEKFMGLKSLKEYAAFSFSATKILPMKSGRVWLLSDKMGCIQIVDSTFSKIEVYNVDNKKLYNNSVNNVYEDSRQDSWILSNSGLYHLNHKTGLKTDFFTPKEYPDLKTGKDFYSVLEYDQYIWFGASNGNIRIYNRNNGQFELLETTSQSSIKYLRHINDNNILIVSGDDGFIVYNKPTKTLKIYNKTTLPAMRVNRIMDCYVDKSQNVWLDMDCLGVAKFNLQKEELKHYDMKIESSLSTVFPPNFFIFEDRENRLWIHPRGGGFSIYDPVQDRLQAFYNEPSSLSWRFSNILHTGFSDRQGNLWLSTRTHGLEKIIFNSDLFQSEIMDDNTHSTINNDTRSIYEDSRRQLWVSTKGERIFIYDSDKRQLGYLCQDGSIGAGKPLAGVVYSILEDDKNNIWLGTKGEGLYKLTPQAGKNQYNISNYKNDVSDIYSLSDNNIYSIFQDREKRIWIGTYGGGINLLESLEGKRFINHRNNLNKYPIQSGAQVRVISADKQGNICVGTTFGLILFPSRFETVNQIEYKTYARIPSDKESLSANDIFDICTTAAGETFIATFGGGINKISETDAQGFPLKFVSYTTNNGMPSNVCLSIIEDGNKGKLWISTEGSLTKFDPEKEVFETYSEINRLIKGQNFSEGAKCKTHAGKLYFGHSKGYLEVNPKKIRDNTFKPYMALTRFKLFNKDVNIDDNSPLKVNIDDTEKLELDHAQNFFSLEFAALDMVEPKNILYAYKLEGFDEDWIYNQKQRVANYTNLLPGKYIFKVRSTNSDGIWVDNERGLPIIIHPAFWQTGWAYFAYFLLFVLIMFITLKVIFIFYRLKDKVALEQEETEMKTRFFTDISHEIRTPLTMIVSPVENMLQERKVGDEIRTQLEVVLKNANRMLRMVNQILDFRKIQKQKLSIQETDLGVFITEVCRSFNKTAESQGVVFSVNNLVQAEKVWVDRDGIEKIVFNLLSNAFKHTTQGEGITVSVFKKDKQICLQVKDEGEGMTKDVQNKLFTRFGSFSKDKNKPSTGIGLSIVKEIADKHHARIVVESDVHKGSSFTLFFQTGFDHFDDDVNIVYSQYETIIPKGVANDTTAPNIESTFKANDEELSATEDTKLTILVVEDDTDLRAFIINILNPYYCILEATNGAEGYKLAQEQIPDFIVSDIMMPQTNGIELLQQIRKNNNTSHIPFILLTAKSNIESKLEGLDYGADDYITKPFNVVYFRARIDNILKQRKRLYDRHFTLQNQDNINAGVLQIGDDEQQEPLPHIHPRDAQFLDKVVEAIEQNIDDSQFLVDDLVANLSMSRTVFFKKMKSLTGLSPIEFIRDVKITYAARLIESQQYSIKEVSFMIGISDTKYFTQLFKKAYNMTPSEYKISKQPSMD
ncbi:MAG: hypothetical protein RL662_1280 [Bacteroidota bacterium]|jgi:signal transduction histidine kinase/DNA-binding response OmpR family regulator/ligand-binding sensor domain-containing protein